MTAIDINALAQEIRRVDGNHDLGAGALAEALWPFIAAAQAEARADERTRITAGIKRERDNYYTDTQNEGFDVAGRIARNGGHL